MSLRHLHPRYPPVRQPSLDALYVPAHSATDLNRSRGFWSRLTPGPPPTIPSIYSHDSGSTTNFAAQRLPSGSVGILPSFTTSALECALGPLGRELPARPHTSSFGPVWIPFLSSVCFPLEFRGCVGRPSIVSASLPSTLSPALRLRVLDFERLRTENNKQNKRPVPATWQDCGLGPSFWIRVQRALILPSAFVAPHGTPHTCIVPEVVRGPDISTLSRGRHPGNNQCFRSYISSEI